MPAIRSFPIAAALFLALLPAAAPAAPTITTLDGPSADVRVAGGIDVAADGTGALVYLKSVGGVDHVFVSRLSGGVWSAPTDLTPNLNLSAREAKVAAYPGGGTVVAYRFGPTTGSLIGMRSPGTGQAFTGADIVDLDIVKAFDIDAAPDGTAYVSYTEAFNVHAAIWPAGGSPSIIASANNNGTQGVLDRTAGEEAADPGGQFESDIAAYPGGAVMAWSETDSAAGAGVRDMIARRLTGATPGPPLELTVDTLDAKPRGTTGEMGDVAVAPDGTAQVAFRHGQLHGVNDFPRTVVRRIAPDGALGTPQIADGLPATPTEATEFPALDLSPDGAHGLVAAPRQLTFHTFGSRLSAGTWAAGTQVSTGTPTAGRPPATAVGNDGFGVIAWPRVEGADESVEVVSGRGVLAQPSERISVPGAGEIAFNDTETVTAAADATGTTHVLFAQGAAATRRIVVATVAAPPLPPAPPPPGPPAPPGGTTQIPAPTTPARTTFALRPAFTLPSTVRRRSGRLRITLRSREPFPVRVTLQVRRRPSPGRRARTLLTTTVTVRPDASRRGLAIRTVAPRIRSQLARATLREGVRVTLRATVRAPEGRARTIQRVATVRVG